MSIPGNTNIFIDLISCLSTSSRGVKPNATVHVCVSSEIAGIINFSTLREQRAFKIVGEKENQRHRRKYWEKKKKTDFERTKKNPSFNFLNE